MNYKIGAIEVLLNKSCILERYYPLIPFKEGLLRKFRNENILTKEDAFNSIDILASVFKNDSLVRLFRRFLNMYEVRNSKLKELDKLNLTKEERKSFEELYLLPGVKETRARLYYLSSLKSLKDIANKTADEIIGLTQKAIVDNNLLCKPPLKKEVLTHIVVATVIKNWQ